MTTQSTSQRSIHPAQDQDVRLVARHSLQARLGDEAAGPSGAGEMEGRGARAESRGAVEGEGGGG